MPPTGSPDKAPGAPPASLAHKPISIHSLTNSPTSSSGSGSLLDWTTSAGSSDMFDLTSPLPHTLTPVLPALPTPPSTAAVHDANHPSNRGAAPPHIALQRPTAADADAGAHAPHTGAFTINWDELTFPTDWISPSPSVSGATRVSRPSSTAPSARDVVLPRELVDKAFAALHRVSVEDMTATLTVGSAQPAPPAAPALTREEPVSPSANSHREVTAVGTPSRRPSPVPTILNEDEELSPTLHSRNSSAFNLFVERDTVAEIDEARSDHRYQQLRPTNSVVSEASVQLSPTMPPLHLFSPGAHSTRSAETALSYSSPPVSPHIQQFVDAFRLMAVAPPTRETAVVASPSTRSPSPLPPHTSPTSSPVSDNGKHEFFSPTRSIPVGSILSAAPSTESQSRVPMSPRSSTTLATLLQAQSSLDASTITLPDPSRGRQRHRRDFPPPTESPVIRPSGLPSYSYTDSESTTAASSVVHLAPDAVPMSASSAWAPPQSWSVLSVTQPLAAAEPLTKYGRRAHPLPPTPPLPSQTGNMFTSQPLFWTEPLDPPNEPVGTTGFGSSSSHRTQKPRPPLPPVPVELFAPSAAAAAPVPPPVSAYLQNPKTSTARTLPTYTGDGLPPMLPPPTVPTGFQPWAATNTNAYPGARATVPWSPLAPAVCGMNAPSMNTMGFEHAEYPSAQYYPTSAPAPAPAPGQQYRRACQWSPPPIPALPPPMPPIAPHPVPAPPPPPFMSSPSPAPYGYSDSDDGPALAPAPARVPTTARMMHWSSPDVSAAASPFIPSLTEFELDGNAPGGVGGYAPWGMAHPAPTGVRFLSPLPSPRSATPSTPRAEADRQRAWAGDACVVDRTGDREERERERRAGYDSSAGVRFAPPAPPSSSSASASGMYARDRDRDEHELGYSFYAPVIPVIPPYLPPVPPAAAMAGESPWTTATSSRRYAFVDASVAFKVEQTLFKVHRSFFERHSGYFRRILAGYSYGSSSPVHLPDVKKLDFERLLSIFYPSDLSKPDIVTLKGWLAVLALSQKWEMDQLKRLCVRHIGHLAWPMEKLIIAHKYGLHTAAGPAWLFAAYKEVCTRSVPLALRDAEQLSMELVVGIWEVQHEVGTMRLHGESVEATERRVEELVKEKFGQFEVDTPPATPTGRMPSFSSWQ